MIVRLHAITLFAIAALLTGCETTDPAVRKAERERREQEERRLRTEYFSRIHEAELRVWRTLEPLMQEAADYREEETTAYLGAVFVTERFYSEAFQEEVAAAGLGPWITVLTVFPESPAAMAGLRAGDRLLAVNGKPVPQGNAGTRWAARRLKKELSPDAVNTLEVQRGDERLTIEAQAGRGVYYPVVVLVGPTADLVADGDAIWIHLDLVESLQGEDYLAYLSAYALAQNVMRHAKKQGHNAFLGQALDIAAALSGVGTGGIFGSLGAQAYEHAFRIEADLIAIYLLASTGRSFAGYPEFWEEALKRGARKGKLGKREIERLESMRKVVAAVSTKLESGEDVFPDEYLAGDVSEID